MPFPRNHDHPYEPHLGESRVYWRDIILGINDGLVSIFLLVAGVVGGGLANEAVLLTGVAGALAGAVSMATGEWLATKSQEEVFDRELELERHHIRWHRQDEVDQLHQMFGDLGLTGETLDAAVAQVASDDDAMLEAMKRLEFGVIDEDRRSPAMAAVYSGLLFLLGAVPSVLPFVVADDPFVGLLWAGALTGIALFTVGVVKTRVTGTNPWKAGAENLMISMAGAIVSYWVGRLFDAA